MKVAPEDQFWLLMKHENNEAICYSWAVNLWLSFVRGCAKTAHLSAWDTAIYVSLIKAVWLRLVFSLSMSLQEDETRQPIEV